MYYTSTLSNLHTCTIPVHYLIYIYMYYTCKLSNLHTCTIPVYIHIYYIMYNYYEGQITDIINITSITYEADTNRTGTYLLYMYNR